MNKDKYIPDKFKKYWEIDTEERYERQKNERRLKRLKKKEEELKKKRRINE